jgi:hypothetical protein
MVLHPCPKCGMIFNKKSNFNNHINKKYDCSLREKNKAEVFQNFPNLIQNFPNFPNQEFQDKKNFSGQIESKKIIISDQDNSKYNLKDDLSSLNDCFACGFCFKEYSTKGNLTKHIKNCKVKKDNDIEKENIFKLLLEKDEYHKKEIDNLKEQNKIITEQNKLMTEQNKELINKLDKLIKLNNDITPSQITNNINSNNTQNNNIMFVNFGKEDLRIIDKNIFLKRVVNGRVSGVKIPEEILKIIHFNPDYPQLSNIYISDINREKCMIFEDGEWKLSPIDKIPEVIEKVVSYSNELNEDLRIQYPNNKKINDRLDVIKKYNNMNDTEYVEELKEDIDDNKELIKRCEDFQKLTYDTFKTTLYNEGKKIKKNIK